jgi:hypothetical protein
MQFLETVNGVVAAMLTSPLYISQVKKGSGLPAAGRPFFAHADRPDFGAAAMGGRMVPSRRLDHHRGKPG